MRAILYHEAAEQELLTEVAHLEGRAAGLGKRLLEEIGRAEALLANTPEASPEIHPGLRAKVLKTFRYSIIYCIESECVLVLAIAHHRRRPLYWLGRAGEKRSNE